MVAKTREERERRKAKTDQGNMNKMWMISFVKRAA